MFISATYLLIPAFRSLAYVLMLNEITDLDNLRTERTLDVLIIVDLHQGFSKRLNGSTASLWA